MEIIQFDTSYTIIVVIVLIMLCRLAMVMHWLTFSGSVAAFMVAVILFYGGWHFFLLPLVLLVGGTLLSRLNRDDNEKEGRNAIQVMANGGVGIACLLAFYAGYENCFEAFIVSFTISICDTFSSETGKYYGRRTVDILTFKPVVKGLSGGISLAGTLGGLVGALIGAFIASPVMKVTFASSVSICVFGMAGMLLDSVLGSTIQAKYITGDGIIEERPAPFSKLYRGYGWCTNDMVNVLSNMITTLLFLLLN